MSAELSESAQPIGQRSVSAHTDGLRPTLEDSNLPSVIPRCRASQCHHSQPAQPKALLTGVQSPSGCPAGTNASAHMRASCIALGLTFILLHFYIFIFPLMLWLLFVI